MLLKTGFWWIMKFFHEFIEKYYQFSPPHLISYVDHWCVCFKVCMCFLVLVCVFLGVRMSWCVYFLVCVCLGVYMSWCMCLGVHFLVYVTSCERLVRICVSWCVFLGMCVLVCMCLGVHFLGCVFVLDSGVPQRKLLHACCCITSCITNLSIVNHKDEKHRCHRPALAKNWNK